MIQTNTFGEQDLGALNFLTIEAPDQTKAVVRTFSRRTTEGGRKLTDPERSTCPAIGPLLAVGQGAVFSVDVEKANRLPEAIASAIFDLSVTCFKSETLKGKPFFLMFKVAAGDEELALEVVRLLKEGFRGGVHSELRTSLFPADDFKANYGVIGVRTQIAHGRVEEFNPDGRYWEVSPPDGPLTLQNCIEAWEARTIYPPCVRWRRIVGWHLVTVPALVRSLVENRGKLPLRDISAE